MGRITGMDYRNGLPEQTFIYAALGTSYVFHMLIISYNSHRESFVLKIGSLRYHKNCFPDSYIGGWRVCVCGGGGGGLLVQKFLG